MNQPLRRNKLGRVSNEDGTGNDFAAIRSSKTTGFTHDVLY